MKPNRSLIMCDAPRISPEAHDTLTRPLITIDGRFDRGAISAKALSEFRAGRAWTWSQAMKTAMRLAKRQIEAARAYDAARRDFQTAPRSTAGYRRAA